MTCSLKYNCMSCTYIRVLVDSGEAMCIVTDDEEDVCRPRGGQGVQTTFGKCTPVCAGSEVVFHLRWPRNRQRHKSEWLQVSNLSMRYANEVRQ